MNSADDRTTLSSLRHLLRRMLGPVSRMLLRHGLNHRELVQVIKEAYVKAAAEQDVLAGVSVNISRVALITGMARRDVRTIVNQPETKSRDSDVRQNNSTRVLSGWFQDREFSKSNDEPLPLTPEGKRRSFDALVKRYASDIPPGTIAKELSRVKAIRRDDDGNYVAISRYYMPANEYPLTPDAIERTGSVLEDLGETIDYNLNRQKAEPSRFERRATNAKISSEDVPEFRRFVESEGQRFLETIDAWLTEHEQSEDAEGGERLCRLGMGAYWIEESTQKGK